ncbi:MAG: ABC transporter permease [Lachnospiraceae bacterium]|nr:ABC transporter permease [Lachnospiraceae bacterium]
MLIRKMWRDLLKSKVQFLSIFLMSLLGMYVFVGLDSEANGMRVYEESYYEQNGLADIWVQGKAFTDDDLRKIQGISGVIKAEKRLNIDGKALMPGDRELNMQMNFIDASEISRMLIVDGEPYTPGESGVWLDFIFCREQKLGIGDSIKLKADGKEFDEIIKGTFYHPEYVYFLPDAAAVMPAYGEYGACFIDSSEYPVRDELYYNLITADLEGVDNTGGLSDEEKGICQKAGEMISDVLNSEEIVTTNKNENLSYQTFHAEIEQHASMTYLFPIVFLLIAILGIITTMTRMTSRQRVQIGTLKALGLSKRTITIHYASYSFFLSLMGSIVGALLGYCTIAELIIGMEADAYLVPDMSKAFSVRAFGGIAVSVAVSTLVSFMSCRKQLAPAPAETLRPASPKNLKHSAIEKSRLWLKLDFATQWNIRDIMRNKVRSAMGVVGVLGCSMLLFGAFACLDTMNFITSWMYGELNTSRYQIIMKQGTPYTVTEEYAKKYSGQMIENAGVEFEVNGVKKSGTLTVYDVGNYLHFEDKNLKEMSMDGKGIAMTYKMSRTLGLAQGDMFRWHMVGDDKWHVNRISAIYRHPTSQGIAMSRDMFEGLEFTFIPDTVYTNKDARTDLDGDDNIIGVQNKDEMMDAFDSMKEMMYTMVYILVMAAVVLGIVVLYNLGVLSLVEKNREMATLKVLGFTTRKIRGILQMQNIWLTALGILLGIPAGMGLVSALFASMPESMDYIATYSVPSVMYTVAGTFTLSIAVNRLLSGKVKTVDMVDALKGQE